MLFFFAGYEIDFERIRGKPLTLGALGWLLSLALAYGIGGVLAAAGVVVSFLYTGSALATTAIGTLIPILRDGGELKTRFGTFLLAAGAVGEFGPILLITLVLSTTQPLHEALILARVHRASPCSLALASVRLAWRGFGALERTLESSSQLAIRIATVLVFGLVLLASELGLDLLLGGFVAGMIVRAALRGREIEVVRVEADRGRLRLPDPVLLRRERDQLRPRGARLGRGDRQAVPLPRRSSWSSAGCPALLLYRGVLDARDRLALGLLQRHRAAAGGRDHDPRDRGRGDALLDRGRSRRRGDALDPDLPLRRAWRCRPAALGPVTSRRARARAQSAPGGRSAAPA